MSALRRTGSSASSSSRPRPLGRSRGRSLDLPTRREHVMRFIVLVAALVIGSASLAAHHSAIQFDFTNTKAVTGVVKKFIAINPHMQLVLRVKDEKGERDIEFEGHSTNNMYRAGYRDNMIKVGDTITVYIAPLKDGSDGGYVTAALTASGTRFGARSRAEVEQERLKAEGKK